MSDTWPKIITTNRIPVSRWLEVVTRDVQLTAESTVETFYAISQPNYLAALALTPENRILLVRQYRPAIEAFSLELPAGMLEQGETPSDAIARELLEETGFSARSITLLGVTATCTSRISNTMYSFFIETNERDKDFVEEPGVAVSSASVMELRELILAGKIVEPTHLGVITLAACKGLLIL
jgi:ADP-ribose pyrophosphatase